MGNNYNNMHTKYFGSLAQPKLNNTLVKNHLYTCRAAHVHTHTYTRTQTQMHIHTHTHAHVHMHACTAHTHTHTHGSMNPIFWKRWRVSPNTYMFSITLERVARKSSTLIWSGEVGGERKDGSGYY